MRKKIILGFFIIGTLTFSENKFGTDVQENEKILVKMRLENNQLKEDVNTLKEELIELKNGLIKVIKYEDQGIIITRKPDLFIVDMKSENYKSDKYIEFFDSLIEVMKYDVDTPVTITGSKINIEYISTYFINNGVDEDHLLLEETDDKTEEQLDEIKIIFKQKIVVE